MIKTIRRFSALSWVSNNALRLVLVGLGAGLLVFGKGRSQKAISLTIPTKSSTIDIRVRDYPKDIFPVQFPEVVEGDEGYFLGPEVAEFRESDAKWQHPSLYRWLRTYVRSGVGRYAISIDVSGDEIDTGWRVENLSNKKWHYVSATAHLNFTKAPDFFDPAEDRTFVRVDGKWVALKNTDHSEGAWANQWYVLRNYRLSEFMQSIRGSKSSFGLSQTRLDDGLVAVAARDGRMVVGQTFARVQYICHSSECVHPCADLGDIPSGKEASAAGKIYFIRGGLDDLLRRARQDFPSTID